MSVIRKLRIKFIAVFMAAMLFVAVAVGAAIYLEQKKDLEYNCMVYLLDINNFENQDGYRWMRLASYPPYFVLEIDNIADTAKVVLGRFFLADRGISVRDLMLRLIGTTAESAVLEDYQVRYFNGIRQQHSHRIAFIDVSYIQNTLNSLLQRIVTFGLLALALLFVIALPLSGWYAKPARDAIEDQRRFISKVSHELKTPVSIVRANIDLIDQSQGKDESAFEFGCENIRSECERMTGLVDAMLLTALPARRGMGLQQRVDVTRLLQKETLRFEVVAFDHGLELTLDAEEGLSLRGDETQLTRLFDILLENAVKYGAEGGSIRVTAAKKAGIGRRSVRIVCANTGEEIPKEIKEAIFKPFYQVDGTKAGAGLGLSIAHEIVYSMNGAISVEYENGQNCFVLEL